MPPSHPPSRSRRFPLLHPLALCVLLSASVARAEVDRADAVRSTAETRARVARLIEHLGATSYNQRQRAEDELRRLGPLAIDQLLQAQYSENYEISSAARYLLGQLSPRWMDATDPEIVQLILKDYQSQPLSERISRSSWLAALLDGLGIAPVCRIVRYDRSEIVAKQAALRLMQFLDVDDEVQTRELDAAVTEVLGDCARGPADWLRALRQGLQDPQQQLTSWRRFTDAELQLEPGARTTREVGLSLLRWYAEFAARHASVEETRGCILRLVKEYEADPYQLLDVCHMLVDHKQWEVLDDLFQNQFPELAQRQALMLYCAAEAKQRQGDEQAAEELARQAFERTSQQTVDPQEQIVEQFRCAVTLENRGLATWAIREYRRIADAESPTWRMEFYRERAIRLLAELLHDRRRDQEAADVLESLVNASRSIRFSRREFENDWNGVVSRMHFFRSEQHRQAANFQEQVAQLRKGIQVDPTDADVLIAMYRLPRADREWQDLTRRGIQHAIGVFEDRLRKLRGNGVLSKRNDIATELNQLAWLVGNTEGDQQAAVRQSRRSLELRPRSAGFMDTLGRAYFASGDLENALRYQRRAVALEPHSQQIRRQLLEFEQARDES